MYHLVAATAFGILAGNPKDAQADEIKTLDMSLPSYGAINTLKGSAEKDKGMGVENLPEAADKSRPSKKNAAISGNPLGNVLPSMNKSAGKKPRSLGTATAATERPAKRIKEEKEDEIKTMDMSLPSYSDGTQGKVKSAFAL
jgi:hypothetical protein